MMDYARIIYVLIILYFVTRGSAVGTGGTCSTTEDCTKTNIHSHCYHWITQNSCPHGTCRCDPGYGGIICEPLLQIQTIDEICNRTFVCDKELHCDLTMRRCICATTTFVFKPALNTCLAHKSRVINETCSTSDECYNRLGAEDGMECRGTNVKICQCKLGYIEIEGLCQKPHYGHSCYAGVGCATMTHPKIHIDDPSRVTEQCIAGVCECPSNSEHLVAVAFERLLDYCLSYPDVPLKMAGEPCTRSSECVTKVCISCPGSNKMSRTCAHIKSSRAGRLLIPHDMFLMTWILLGMWYYCVENHIWLALPANEK